MEQTKANENLSQWFNLDEQKPWEPGVYEVDGDFLFGGRKTESGAFLAAYFDGIGFGFVACVDDVQENSEFTIDRVENRFKHGVYNSLVTRWRGLASDPSAKPKARGNRKVTRYVVMESLLVNDRAVASFEKRKVADAYLKMNPGCPMLPNYIKKIRFRTPEAD